jgi:rhomboid protease GluP
MLFQQRNPWQLFIKTAPVTSINIVLVTVMFVVTLFSGGFTNVNLFRLGGLFAPSVVENNEWWRLVSVMYLHGSFMHYFFNTLFGLVIISAALERIIGPVKFGIIYFVSGVGASLITVGVQYLNNTFILGVGASGAIYGVLGSFLWLTVARPEWFGPTDIQNIRGLILINIVFTFLVPNISVSAHLGGLASGVALTLLLAPARLNRGGRKRFMNPYENTYDPFSDEGFTRLEEVEYVDDEDDEDDPWGRYS